MATIEPDNVVLGGAAPSVQLSGRIGGGLGSGRKYNTLDEPITDTFMRDVHLIRNKLTQVFFPTGESASLNDWDLWGPLLLCLVLAILKTQKHAEEVFTGVFVIVWCGAAIVTLNSKLLGGTLSFLQSVCILGYCLFPLVIASIISLFFSYLWARLIFSMLGFGWAVYASVGFLSDSSLPNRKALAVYPIFLFYFFISWVIIITHPAKEVDRK